MTKEEAIKWLDNMNIKDFGWDEYAMQESQKEIRERCEQCVKEALDMAIEALKNKPIPCEKCIHVKSCRKIIILKNRTYKLIKYCSQGVERSEK